MFWCIYTLALNTQSSNVSYVQKLHGHLCKIFKLKLIPFCYGFLEWNVWTIKTPDQPSTGWNITVNTDSLHCEPKGCLWSNECAASRKHSWEFLDLQQMIHGSHSPGQQFSLYLVEAKDGWSRFPLSKNCLLIQQGGFEMIWYSK